MTRAELEAERRQERRADILHRASIIDAASRRKGLHKAHRDELLRYIGEAARDGNVRLVEHLGDLIGRKLR